jgi:hypothetical protein
MKATVQNTEPDITRPTTIILSLLDQTLTNTQDLRMHMRELIDNQKASLRKNDSNIIRKVKDAMPNLIFPLFITHLNNGRQIVSPQSKCKIGRGYKNGTKKDGKLH